MNWEAIGAVAGLIGVALVIVSLIYVGIQIRQSNHDARSQARQNLLDTFGMLGWELASQPDLLVLLAKGLTDWPGLSNLEKTRFDNVMGRYLRNLQRGVLQHRDGILDEETLDSIGNQMLHAVLMPSGREWYEQSPLVSPEVRRYIDARIARSDTLPLPAEQAMPYWIALARE